MRGDFFPSPLASSFSFSLDITRRITCERFVPRACNLCNVKNMTEFAYPHRIHPGIVLMDEFLRPLELSQNRLALDMRVPAHRISEIVRGKRRISADTALRLSLYFQTTAQFWLNLQMEYDLANARIKLSEQIQREITNCAPPIRQRYV